MDEQFLHYIWKFKKFEDKELKTTDRLPLKILNPGSHNHDSGPDFEEARIKIDKVEWAGSVEIHVKSSDWEKHYHQSDRSYDNVVLHVVWKDDKPVFSGKEPIPTLELLDIIDLKHFEKYQTFLSQHKEILCQDQLSSVADINFTNMLDRTMIERLEQKSLAISQILRKNNQDWENTAYISLAKNFGFSTNSQCFTLLAESLPYKVLSRYHGKSKHIEALIFGVAGFLEDEVDTYQSELRSEYQYLKNKHQLKQKLTRQMWKFARMRPSNFPSVRLAQFSSLISLNEHLFSNLIMVANPRELVSKFQISVSEYWVQYYDFGKARKKKRETLGKSTQENLLVNTVAPLLAAYSYYNDDQRFMDRAVKILEQMPTENNKITRKWIVANKKPKNAFDSQALIGLYKNYCEKKKCLNCNIGVEILGQ